MADKRRRYKPRSAFARRIERLVDDPDTYAWLMLPFVVYVGFSTHLAGFALRGAIFLPLYWLGLISSETVDYLVVDAFR